MIIQDSLLEIHYTLYVIVLALPECVRLSHYPGRTDRCQDLIFSRYRLSGQLVKIKFKGQGNRSKVKLSRSIKHCLMSISI